MRLQDIFENEIATTHSGEAVKRRAEAAGFDTSKVYYHGSRSGLDEMDRIFWVSATPELASEYAYTDDKRNLGGLESTYPVYLRRDLRLFNANRLQHSIQIPTMLAEMNRQSSSRINEDELETEIWRLRQCASVEESGPSYAVFDFWYDTESYFGWKGALLLNELWKRLGYDGIAYREMGHNTVGVFDPQRNVRGIFAKFQPGGHGFMESAIKEANIPPARVRVIRIPGVKLHAKLNQWLGKYKHPKNDDGFWSGEIGTMEDREYWIALDGGRVVGFISYYYRDDENRYAQKYIKITPKYRNKGLATELINQSFREIIQSTDADVFVNGFSGAGRRDIYKLMMDWKSRFPDRFLIADQ